MTVNEARKFIDCIVEHEGDRWLVGSTGVVTEEGVYCHLWSKTRTLLKQKNGREIPVQSCDFVPIESLRTAYESSKA